MLSALMPILAPPTQREMYALLDQALAVARRHHAQHAGRVVPTGLGMAIDRCRTDQGLSPIY